MNQRPYPRLRPPRARLALLVLAVLTGLVAMHGPATAGLPGGPSPRPAGHAVPASAAAPADSGGDECAHSPRGAGSHPNHADPTCAAGGISGAPILPALAPSTGMAAVDASAAARRPADSLDSRAPPSLSDLQLLRV